MSSWEELRILFRGLTMPVWPRTIPNASLVPFLWPDGQTPRRQRRRPFARLCPHGPGEMNDSTAGGGCKVGAELHPTDGAPSTSVLGRVPFTQPSGMFLDDCLWTAAPVVYATDGTHRHTRHASSGSTPEGMKPSPGIKVVRTSSSRTIPGLAQHPLIHIH